MNIKTQGGSKSPSQQYRIDNIPQQLLLNCPVYPHSLCRQYQPHVDNISKNNLWDHFPFSPNFKYPGISPKKLNKHGNNGNRILRIVILMMTSIKSFQQPWSKAVVRQWLRSPAGIMGIIIVSTIPWQTISN